jgi:hypothetical protein
MSNNNLFLKKLLSKSTIQNTQLIQSAHLGPGPKGATGMRGPAGLKGETGMRGPAGLKGETGMRGPTGLIGPAGTSSNTGATGLIGHTGQKGNTGPNGPAGTASNTGATGLKGPTGPIGRQGNNGPAGTASNTGATGLKGPTGPIGRQGNNGPAGTASNTGATGLKGPTGPTGTSSNTGPTGPTGPINTLNSTSSGLILYNGNLLLNTEIFLLPVQINVTSISSVYMLELYITSIGYNTNNSGGIKITFAGSQSNDMTTSNSSNLYYYLNQISENFYTMTLNNSGIINYHLINMESSNSDYILTTTRLVIKPDKLGVIYFSPVIFLTGFLPSQIYFNFSVIQLN